ncbi:MAG: cyclase family protein [Chlamydiales bacterium]|nr:cyclase family protein [Chlamydiales bacterium]
MKYRLIDLSLPLETTLSEPEPIHIERIDHRQGAVLLTQGSGLHADHFPDGLGLSLERIRLTSHSGTHVDAPLHYGPLSEGKKARSIDEMPLDWFFGPAVMLDCKTEMSFEPVTCDDLKHAIFSQELTLEAGDIVFINTGADSLWGTHEYFTSFRGISAAATEWLLDLGIRVIGVDSFGFDAPFQKMIQSYLQSENSQTLWPCHVLGRSREYCQIERLANLSTLPNRKKFLASCFPIKLKGCGAGPSRVVALLEEDHD